MEVVTVTPSSLCIWSPLVGPVSAWLQGTLEMSLLFLLLFNCERTEDPR